MYYKILNNYINHSFSTRFFVKGRKDAALATRIAAFIAINNNKNLWLKIRAMGKILGER